jgi:hypothetical protein
VQKQALRGLFLAWIGCGLAIPAIAQSPEKAVGKWEVEFHVGKPWVNDSHQETTTFLPEPYPSFTTIDGGTSRFVPSWYFGDGALLLNQVQALDPSQPERIVPLDPVLTAPVIVRKYGIPFGARLSRAITSWLGGELTVEYRQDHRTVPPDVSNQINASSATFESTWRSLFAAWKSTSPVRPFGAISQSRIDKDKNAGQLLLDGTLNVALRTRGRIIPYVSGGVGYIAYSKEQMGVDVQGAYASGRPGAGLIEEFDYIHIRSDNPDHLVVGVLGGGIKYFVTPGWGIRFDARTHFAHTWTETVTSDGGGGFGICLLCYTNPGPAVAFGSTPAIQINSIPDPLLPNYVPTSLTGSFGTLHTFRSSGIQQQIVISVGVIRRF